MDTKLEHEISDYLLQFEETMPEWLNNYAEGMEVTFDDVMSGRVGYYPGSGYDGTLMKVGNMSRAVHSYLYVDYGISKSNLKRHLSQKNSVSGYHRVGRIEWTQHDIMPNGQYPLHVNRKPQHGCTNWYMLRDEQPYCFTDIMERDNDKNDEWGAKRFAITFLFADGIAIYHQLFCKEYGKAPWICLLQDHGLGGNYDRFGKYGILDEIIKESGVRPEFVICATNTRIWDGYEAQPHLAAVCGGMHRNPRVLYKKKLL